MKTLFVSGTDTEIGKTWISCQILRHLRAAGHRVGAWKPVCSGAVEDHGRLVWEDVEFLIRALGEDRENETVANRVCSQRFQAPMAPNIAARLEDRQVSGDDLRSGLDAWQGHADFVLGEGAGGLLSPASDEMLVADLISHLGTPLLIVAANRLGVIHHTLATVEAALSRRLNLQAIILNEVMDDIDPMLADSNERELRRLMPDISVHRVNYGGDIGDVQPSPDFTSWFASAVR